MGSPVRLISGFQCLACFSGRSVCFLYRNKRLANKLRHGAADEGRQPVAVVDDDNVAADARNGDQVEIEEVETADSQ